jgi:hypothetical protein
MTISQRIAAIHALRRSCRWELKIVESHAPRPSGKSAKDGAPGSGYSMA